MQINNCEIKTSNLPGLMFRLYHRTRSSSLYNNAFYLMLNTASTSILGFVFWNIMSRSFSHAEVGIGSALIAASGLVATIATLGLGSGLIRFIPELGKDAAALINSSFTLTGTVAAIGAVVYLFGLNGFAPALHFLRSNHWYAGFFIFVTIATVISGLVDQSLIAARSSCYVFYRNLIISLLKIPLPVLLFLSLKGYGIFAGTGAAVLTSLLVTVLFFLPKAYNGYYPRPQWEGSTLSRVLPFSLSNYLSGLLASAPVYLYPLMVLNQLGPEQNAYFTMAWMIAMVLTVIPGSLAQSLFAEGSHNPGRLGGGGGRRALLIAILLTIPAVGLLALTGGWLLHFFGLAYAHNGTGLLRILVLSMIPLCINSFFMTVNQVKKEVSLIIGQSAFVAVISIILGYWLMSKIGLEGIGLAYLLAQTMLAVIIIKPLWKELKMRG